MDSSGRARVAALTLSLLASARVLPAQEALGRITFPTSGSAAAEPEFIRGVLLLHSFEYGRAAESFKKAQQADPAFAMAYWGEALTYTHQVWNEQDITKARAALAPLGRTSAERIAKAKTPRERMYLASVEALYGDGPKARRDTAYADALAEIVRAYPDDDEAKVFYSVALLGLSQGVRDIPTYMRAGAIAQDVFRRNEEHPGAAHFIIHAFDDPVHAPLGLYAARRYSVIAPGAAHAQHMTTHIFLALGMWDDVVRQNEIASGHDASHWMPGHYTHWLAYAYLQQGRYRDARRLIADLTTHAGPNLSAARRGQLANFRSRYVLETGDWKGAEALALSADHQIDGEDGYGYAAFTDGHAALHRGDRATAEKVLADMQRQLGPRLQSVRPGDEGSKVVPVIMALELHAELRQMSGATSEAIALLRKATALEDAMPPEFGPPAVPLPSHEMLGALFLETHAPAEAVREYEKALALAPGRAAALLGMARAARAAGQDMVAGRAYRDLAANWHAADSELAALAEVRGKK